MDFLWGTIRHNAVCMDALLVLLCWESSGKCHHSAQTTPTWIFFFMYMFRKRDCWAVTLDQIWMTIKINDYAIIPGYQFYDIEFNLGFRYFDFFSSNSYYVNDKGVMYSLYGARSLHLPCETIKSLYFNNGLFFFVEQKITSNLTYIGRITSASFDTTFVGKMFMLDCPTLKLGNCQNTFAQNLGLEQYKAHYMINASLPM